MRSLVARACAWCTAACAAILLAPGAVAQEPAEPQGGLSLAQAIEATLRRNPDLRASSYELAAAQARIVQAGLRPNPELALELENFAGTMNFVIFPMYFLSTALYPLSRLQASGAEWVYQVARLNPFTHAVEWIRFALYGQDPGAAPWIVLGCLAVFFALACWGYDPQRGFGQLARRGG